MRMLRIYDEHSTVLGFDIQNETLVCQLAIAQLIVTSASLAQHVYSLYRFNEIFLCSFNASYLPPAAKEKDNYEYSQFLAHDIIIFDFGLFQRLIHVQTCIANHLDGGYLRCLWCVTQLMALLTVLALPFVRNPQPYILWPMLLLQNSYCLGLVILSIASADKFLTALISQTPSKLTLMIGAFFLGTFGNYFLDYVLWHLYWHVEAEHERKVRQGTGAWV